MALVGSSSSTANISALTLNSYKDVSLIGTINIAA